LFKAPHLFKTFPECSLALNFLWNHVLCAFSGGAQLSVFSLMLSVIFPYFFSLSLTHTYASLLKEMQQKKHIKPNKNHKQWKNPKTWQFYHPHIPLCQKVAYACAFSDGCHFLQRNS